MRKIGLLFLLAIPCFAQPSNPGIISVTVAPSGACASGLPNQQVLSTGTQYSCQSGTWTAFSTGGGTGNLSGTLTTGNQSFSSAAHTISGSAGTYYCDAFADLTTCILAANAYATSNESGSGKSATAILSNGVYSTGGTPIFLASGVTVEGIRPRLIANSGVSDTSMVFNGGSIIDCGGGTSCFTDTAGTTNGVRNINLIGLGFKNFEQARYGWLAETISLDVIFVSSAT